MTYAPRTPAQRVRRGIVGTIVVLVVVVVLAVVALLFYANMVMRGERSAAIDAWENPAVSITSTDDSIIMTPTGTASRQGLVFIPGAKVDPYAYMYKLSGIVEETGLIVVITKPTLNLAFFDQRPLSAFIDGVAGVDDWFVGGHSLGGVRACQLADTPDAPKVSGLVLFGSYCATDLSGTTLEVLSIGGQNDGLSTPSKIAAASDNLPADTTFVEIEGLNHAGFGDYGTQSGDGVTTLTSAQQRAEITRALRELFSVE